jgi:hypothetical protein
MDDPTNKLFAVPELACLAAILERALLDASGNIPGDWPGSDTQREARRWLFCWCDSDRKTPFTFPWVCEHLSLCPLRVRKNIKRVVRIRQKTKHIGTSFSKMVIASLDLDTSATGLELYY